MLGHYGSGPRACRPYRAKTKGKIERPYRHVRQDFFLARHAARASLRDVRNIEDMNAQFDAWRTEIAKSFGSIAHWHPVVAI